MALQDVFLSPLGLAALLALVPLVVLYLLEPDPRRLAIPTIEFLADDPDEGGRSLSLSWLRRNLLLLVQALVLVLLAVSLASPYVQVTGGATGGTTVLVVDASASMAARADGRTRFDAAVAAARERVAGTTSVVVAGARTRVALSGGTAEDADRTLSALSVTDAPGDLRRAIARASGVADAEARLVVLSDFVDDSDWRGAVAAARARGQRVDLRQFDRGGGGNVGIVDLAVGAREVTVTLRNAGESRATRTVRLGEQAREVSLRPGDVTRLTLRTPPGGGEVRLTPGDGFPTDDRATVVAPADATVEVLLVTNGRERYLRTAFQVLPEVNLTVAQPPAAVSGDYDVVVFSSVDRSELLDSTVATARETAAAGGGVVVRAQPDVGAVGYGDLLPVAPLSVGNASSVRNTSEVRVVSRSRLVEDIDLPPPDRHLAARLRRGRPIARAADGSPLLATARLGEGRVLYYGFLANASTFRFHYRYPVFWRRAVGYLAGRDPVASLHYETGETARFNASTVRGPDGAREGPTVVLDRAGVYAAGDRRVSANLLSAAESNVTAPPVAVNDSTAGDGAGRRPLDHTPLSVLAAHALCVLEVGVLRYRGDL